MFSFITNIWLAIIILIIGTFGIEKAADKLEEVLHILGLKLHIPTSVRGATFDAIASSFPEFSAAMVSVVIYNNFANIGLPTIAGSGIFNVLLIPMVSILAYEGSKMSIGMEKKAVKRDVGFYVVALLALVIFTVLGQYNIWTGLVLIMVYLGYVVSLYKHTQDHRKNTEREEIAAEDDMSYLKIVFWIIVTMGAIWIFMDGIVKSATVISSALGIHQFIVSVVILAACTSIPDTLISVASAKRGDIDGAVANAIGSNIFDICLCLGLPIVLSPNPISISLSANVGVLIFLFISVLTTGIILITKDIIKNKHSYPLAAVYLLFVVYIVSVAIDFPI